MQAQDWGRVVVSDCVETEAAKGGTEAMVRKETTVEKGEAIEMVRKEAAMVKKVSAMVKRDVASMDQGRNIFVGENEKEEQTASHTTSR